jgi:predicted Zn-dependent protease
MPMAASMAWLAVIVQPLAAQQIANEVVPRQEDLQKIPSGDSQASAPSDSQAENRRVLIEQLVTEMSELIPRVPEQDYPHQDLLVKIATSFVDGDRKTAADLINQLAADDADCPPEGLLMAGLSYAVNDPVRGGQILEQTALSSADYPGVYTAFARLAVGQGRLTDALALLEKAKRLMDAGQFNEKQRNFFQVQYLDAMADVAMQQRRTDDALRYVNELEQIVPDNPKVLVDRAEIEFQKQNIDGSLANLKRLREKVPSSRPPELILASWFQRTGDIAKTDEWIKKAASAYSDDPVVQMEYANWALGREDFPAASIAVNQVEKSTGEVPATKALKGRIAFAKGAYELAESHFNSLFEQEPDNFDIANMLALCLIESPDAAKRDKGKQIGIRNVQALPDNPIAQAAMGWIFLKSGETEQAKTMLTRASRSPELSPEVAFFLASYLHQSGNSARAKLILEPAIASQGLFLYRTAAKDLMNKIDSSVSDLPNPNK